MDTFIDMTRALPSRQQVELSRPLLHLPGDKAFHSIESIDWRSYGGLQGLREVRELFGPVLLGLPAAQVAVGGNSSLALIHQAISHAWLRGLPQSVPWRLAPRVRFLCPEPGYDRHFALCRYFGIEMLPVRLRSDGPDMQQVVEHVRRDPTVRGMWCMPRHSNPDGTTYSAEVIEQLATMTCAAADFTLFCDTACAVHTGEGDDTRLGAQALHAACVRAGHSERTLVFASTSKLTLPGAGLAFIGGSPLVIDWWLACQRPQTIGLDKVNQIRHLLFFGTHGGLRRHLEQHARLLQARLACVQDIFEDQLGDLPGVDWSRPLGGAYFFCLRLPTGQAHRVAELAERSGVRVTAPGSTHCLGVDPEDRYLRIAPSALTLEQAERAARIIAQAVRDAQQASRLN